MNDVTPITRHGMAKYGERIQQARIGHGYSLRYMADNANLTHVRYSEIERGVMHPASFEELAAITRLIPDWDDA